MLTPPIEPMLAKSADALPDGPGWLFEPKWDGFRTIVFRDGDDVYLQSRDLHPLQRYFPELLAPVRRSLPDRAAVDGEIVIAGPKGLDFEALLLRIHPAASRVAELAERIPASLVVWDLLALGDDDLVAGAVPFAERRRRLQAALAGAAPPVHLTPATSDRAVALDWFDRFEGAGLDGVVAKRADEAYQPGVRAMVKVKHARTADCVVAGFRWHKKGPGTMVGSLLLGLYDDAGVLHHVGIAASFTTAMRKALVDELAPLREGAIEGHPWQKWRLGAETAADAEAEAAAPTKAAPPAEAKAEAEAGARANARGGKKRMPGATSRWNRGKDLSWEPLRPERVCEVAYDHLQGARFRHGTHFQRWRPDKPPAACRYDQLEQRAAYELARIFVPHPA